MNNIYYDIVLTNKRIDSEISYIADSFSVDENRVLRIKSNEFGNVVVKINNDEALTVSEIIV